MGEVCSSLRGRYRQLIIFRRRCWRSKTKVRESGGTPGDEVFERCGRVLVNENLAADRRITQKTLNSVIVSRIVYRINTHMYQSSRILRHTLISFGLEV